MVHISDEATEEKFIELQKLQIILNTYTKSIRICQRDIRRLDMIETLERNDDGTSIYKLPNNTAGNEIDSDYRISQKEDIIVNIDELLVKLNGFLLV